MFFNNLGLMGDDAQKAQEIADQIALGIKNIYRIKHGLEPVSENPVVNFYNDWKNVIVLGALGYVGYIVYKKHKK